MEIPKLQREISLESMKIPEISNFSNGNSIISIGKEKIESLKNSIKEIGNLIEERKELSETYIFEGDKIKLEIDNLLMDNDNIAKNFADKDFMIEKNALRNKKVEISELQLNEKINCWKDIAQLKQELRQYEKELTEKESRLKEINDLMGEGN
jgi:hypothetical protein